MKLTLNAFVLDIVRFALINKTEKWFFSLYGIDCALFENGAVRYNEKFGSTNKAVNFLKILKLRKIFINLPSVYRV